MQKLQSVEVSTQDPSKVWDLVERLGEGGVGSVWKGVHKQTSKVAAIKIIGLDTNEDGLEDVLIEIDILKDCFHDNIVAYIGSWLNGSKELWVWFIPPPPSIANPPIHLKTASFDHCLNALQIAMEYCGGGSVSDCEDILDEPLTEEQIALICRESLKVIFISALSNHLPIYFRHTSTHGCLLFILILGP